MNLVPYGGIRAVLAGQPNFVDAWFPEEDEAAILAPSARDPQRQGDHHFNEYGCYALLAQRLAERILADRASPK